MSFDATVRDVLVNHKQGDLSYVLKRTRTDASSVDAVSENQAFRKMLKQVNAHGKKVDNRSSSSLIARISITGLNRGVITTAS